MNSIKWLLMGAAVISVTGAYGMDYGRENDSGEDNRFAQVFSETNNKNTQVDEKPQCRYCNKQIAHIVLLKKHCSRKHGDKLPYCCLLDPCVQGFWTQKGLEDHIDTEHVGIKSYLCDVCNLYVSNNRTLLIHKQQAHLVCSKCRQAIEWSKDVDPSKQDAIKRHKQSDACKAMEEAEFNVLPIGVSDTSNEIISVATNTYTIDPEVELEWQSDIPQVSLQKEIKLECPVLGCIEEYTKITDFNEHLRGHENNKYTCQVTGCGKNFITKTGLDLHNKSMHEEAILSCLELGEPLAEKVKIPCPVEGCMKTYSYQDNIRRYVKAKHAELDAKKEYQCSVEGCAKTYATRSGLWNHRKKVHPEVMQRPKRKLVWEMIGQKVAKQKNT